MLIIAFPVLDTACKEWGEIHADTQPVATRQQLHRLIRRRRDHGSVYSGAFAQEAAKEHNIDPSPVKTALHLLDSANLSTVGEKFAWLEAQHLQSYSPEFLQGFNAYEETTIPGLSLELSSTSYTLQDMYLRSPSLNEAAQGALSRRIHIASAAEFSDSINGKSDRFAQVFTDAGGSVRAISLEDMYNHNNCNNYVSCYPLM